MHTGFRHDDLYFLDGILHDDNANCLVGEHNSIVILILETHARNLIYGIYDLVIYLKIELRDLLILEFYTLSGRILVLVRHV